MMSRRVRNVLPWEAMPICRVLGISPVLTLNDIGRIDFVHARRIGHRLGPRGVVQIDAKDDRLAFSRPGTLKVRNIVLRARQ